MSTLLQQYIQTANNNREVMTYSAETLQLKLLSTKRIDACERSGVRSPAASAPQVYTLPISLLAGDKRKFGEFRISCAEAVSCVSWEKHSFLASNIEHACHTDR